MKWSSFLLIIFSAATMAGEQKSICGVDDRVVSMDPKVGRSLGKLSDNGGCTLTLIGRSCAITAGHCKSVIGVAEFNTPLSRGGKIQHSKPEDIYYVDSQSITLKNDGVGKDWAVLKLMPNKITGQLPGDLQGFYEVSFNKPQVGDEVTITGYGLDRSEPEKNLAQQTQSGHIVRFGTYTPSVMFHNTDTMGGNSGSSIIQLSSNKIVAIHTNGGCYRSGGQNASTLISEVPELIETIKSCLASEEQ